MKGLHRVSSSQAEMWVVLSPLDVPDAGLPGNSRASSSRPTKGRHLVAAPSPGDPSEVARTLTSAGGMATRLASCPWRRCTTLASPTTSTPPRGRGRATSLLAPGSRLLAAHLPTLTSCTPADFSAPTCPGWVSAILLQCSLSVEAVQPCGAH